MLWSSLIVLKTICFELRLQRNVLAKLVIDEKELTISLIEKRKEFEKRINKCKEKQIKLGFRQDESVKSINRYSQFISDKEIIRKRVSFEDKEC